MYLLFSLMHTLDLSIEISFTYTLFFQTHNISIYFLDLKTKIYQNFDEFQFRIKV